MDERERERDRRMDGTDIYYISLQDEIAIDNVKCDVT